MMRHGWSTSLFQAWQQWSTMASPDGKTLEGSSAGSVVDAANRAAAGCDAAHTAVVSGMTDLHLLPGCRIREITRPDASNVQIAAEARRRGGRCPGCGEPGHAGHSRTAQIGRA